MGHFMGQHPWILQKIKKKKKIPVLDKRDDVDVETKFSV